MDGTKINGVTTDESKTDEGRMTGNNMDGAHTNGYAADELRSPEALLEQFNSTDDTTLLGHCLHHLFQQAAERHPENLALVCADKQLTYRQLQRHVQLLTNSLVERGLGRGDLVGIALDRSADLVIVLLAVLHTGAAYVPIDPSFPTDRINHIIGDARPQVIIVESSTRRASLSWNSTCLDLHDLRENTGASKDSLVKSSQSSNTDDLAYVIYTSGSTGKPKGVEITHGALSNLLCALKQTPGCDESDRLLAVTTISFDIAALELFMPLLSGATVVVAMSHETKSPELLLQLISRYGITIMQATPATWQMLLEHGWISSANLRLSKVLCGGDVLPRRLAERLLPLAKSVWNMYGPTEATVWASVWNVGPGEDVCIGKPIQNYKLYVLDENFQSVPIGSEGELFIGGAGLARGYRNKADLTRERFLDIPGHEGKMYRTGDIARYDNRGGITITVLGRADGQVKIRGHRIELGDIEAVLAEHEGVLNAVVTSKEDRLVAYYITRVSEKEVESVRKASIRSWLAERLPKYMIPAFLIELDAFPQTLNNKIDRNALPEPTERIQSSILTSMTQTERSVCEVWANVLGHDNIGLQDNFFEIGGDSVRVVQGQRALEKMFGRLLPTASLFQHYTVEALASYLEGEIGDNTEAGASVASQGFRQNEDIAVIGMACRLPGGISSPNDFWQVLEQGVDATSDVPTDRWDAQEIYDANPEIQGKSYCQRGGFLDSVDEFDAKFFGISPKEARAMDPAHRVMLETSWEGCEHAGYTLEQLRGSQTGVYVGVCNIGAHTNQQCLEDLDGYHVTGTAGATISGRISYVLGLEGPSMTVDTACASSLVTTHMACTALRQGECNMALASGVSLLLNASMHVEFSRLRGMSSDGRCRAFAEESSGTGWAEGCTVILFKRLSDAVRDGNRIWACIRGSAVNHVGRTTPGLTVPSAPAQQRLIRTALEASKLQPQDIDLVEAHGTGTKLGDPIEGASLAAVFGKRAHESEPLWIGSCKSNIGHTQAAAGLAGLIKVVIALDRGVMPRTLYAESPTTAIDWQSANLRLIQKPRAWLSGRPDRPRRAGISAFGIGGTNAHVILEEPPLQFSVGSDQVPLTYPPELPFLLSGQTDAALSEQVIKLHQHIQNSEDKETDRLGHVAYSLATTRTHFRRRIVFMANNKAALLAKLAGKVALPRSSSQGSRIAMLFTGQGCEILGVGNELYEAYPTFRHSMDEVMTHFAALDVGFTLKEVMDAALGTEDAARLQHTDVVQCALFALEVSLWHLWHSWGVKPTILLGHSIGELAAAYAAGVFNLSDACRLVAARGSLMRGLRPGKMISLEADGKETLEAIQHLDATKKIDVAGYNGPSQTIASGDGDAIEQLGSYFVGLGRKVKLLPVSHAFHSHHVEEMLEPLRAVVETIRFNTPKIPIVSCFTGKLADEGQLEQVDYWLLQARHAVQFADGMQTLYEHGVNMFIELGPQPVLAGLGAACLPADNTLAWLPSLVPGSNETTAIQRSLAELHTRHVPLNWHDYFEQIGSFQRVELPTYAFQREHFPLGKAIGTAKLKSVDGGDRKVLRIPRQDTSNLTYRVSWNLVDQEKNPNVVRGASWGILTSEVDLNKSWEREVTGALNHVGIRIIPVKTIEDAKNLHIDGLLCLRDATSADDGGDVVCKAHTMTAKGLTLLQTAAHVDFRPSLVWITRDAVGTGVKDNMVSGLGAGPLWGLMRTARNERPDLPLRLIDLDGSSLHVLHEALALTTEPECVLRSGDVLVPRMERLESPRILSKQPLVRPNGGVLITGGLGGLGRQVATWLAKIHGICYLVLISRRGMDTPGAQEFVACLAELGTQADVVACEMSDSERIKSSLALFDEGRPLRGVIHAAGAQDNGILTALTPERCTTALVPKIDGAWYLHQLTKEMKIDLDFFVLFSSIFGIMGMPGHGSYAAANTFLDALAHTRRAENLPATSIAYGAWEGEGMASGIITSTMTHFTQSGLGMLTIAEGLQQLEDAIRGDRPLTIAAALNQERLQSYYGRGSIPPLYRSLLHRHSNDVGHEWDLSKILSKVSQTQRPVVVMKMVQETIANTLGFADLAEIDLDLPLQDIGLDSLTAVLIRNRLTELTGLPLSARYALQHPNMKSLSHDLFSRIEKDHSEQSPTNRESHATSAPEKVWLDMDAIRKGCVDSSFTFENVSKTAGPPRAVLVTGATGFIGAFIAHELLKCGVTVYCIVRASNDVHGLQRLSETLSGYGLWQDKYATLLHAVVGDMSQPLFGLSEERFNALADQVDSICHSASLVDWMRPLEDYIGPNMISTHETVRLASRGRGKAIHFISTISSVPKYLGYDIKQDDEEYGYTTSKYLAEQMVVASHYRGAKAAVYRLPFITASTETGHFRLDQGDFLHNLISGCLEIGAFPSLDAHMSAVLPVDYISKTVVALMTRDLDRIGQTWDLVHGNPLSFNRFFALLAAASTNQPTIPFLQWRDRALEFISKHPTSPLARIAALLDGISDDKAAVAMVSGWPVVDPILGRVEYAAPTLGEQFAKNYVSRIDLARGKNNGTK